MTGTGLLLCLGRSGVTATERREAGAHGTRAGDTATGAAATGAAAAGAGGGTQPAAAQQRCARSKFLTLDLDSWKFWHFVPILFGCTA